MTTKTLTSELLKPGCDFIIKEDIKDGTANPGSLGYVSTINGTDSSYQNVATINTVLIRRGKGGKPRLMRIQLIVPIFYVENKNFLNVMPKEGDRRYYVRMERHGDLCYNLMDANVMEFLGYALALSDNLKNMSQSCRHKQWPSSKDHPVNRVRRIGDYLEESDPEKQEKLLAPATSIEFRTNFLEESRRMLSSLVRVKIQADITAAEVELNAADFLLFTNSGDFMSAEDKKEGKENKYKFTDDNTVLKATVKKHKEKWEAFKKLYNEKKKKK